MHVGEDRRTPGIARVSTGEVVGHRGFEHFASDQGVQVFGSSIQAPLKVRSAKWRDHGDAGGKCQAFIPASAVTATANFHLPNRRARPPFCPSTPPWPTSQRYA